MIIGSQTSSFNAAMLRCLTFGPSCIHTSSNWSSDHHPAGEDACHNCIHIEAMFDQEKIQKCSKSTQENPTKVCCFSFTNPFSSLYFSPNECKMPIRPIPPTRKLWSLIIHTKSVFRSGSKKSVKWNSDYIAILLRRIKTWQRSLCKSVNERFHLKPNAVQLLDIEKRNSSPAFPMFPFNRYHAPHNKI